MCIRDSCDTLEIAEMVLSGKVNKGLVTHLEQIGTHAVGLSGKDGNMITVEKVMPQRCLLYTSRCV